MTSGRELLREILERPQDDYLRLVYADYIQDQGDESHGMLIRTQCNSRPHTCDHGGWDGCDSRCDGCRDNGRVATILESGFEWNQNPIVPRWQSELFKKPTWFLATKSPGLGWKGERNKQYPNGVIAWATIRRGFADELQLPFDVWNRQADEILATHPVQKVVFTDEPSPGQNADHLWFPGRPEFNKWQDNFYAHKGNCLGEYTTPMALHHYWPKVEFAWDLADGYRRYTLKDGLSSYVLLRGYYRLGEVRMGDFVQTDTGERGVVVTWPDGSGYVELNLTGLNEDGSLRVVQG